MSTRDVLDCLVKEGVVVHVPPKFPSSGPWPRRHLYMFPEMHLRLEAALNGNRREDESLGRLYAILDAFAAGELITVADHPYDKENTAEMARTDPPQEGIFAVRSVTEPGTRLFGAFVERDAFLGLTWRYRRELGGRRDRKFHNAVLQAMGVWERHLPDCKRLVSEDMGDYFSGNITHV